MIKVNSGASDPQVRHKVTFYINGRSHQCYVFGLLKYFTGVITLPSTPRKLININYAAVINVGKRPFQIHGRLEFFLPTNYFFLSVLYNKLFFKIRLKQFIF